MIQYECKSVPGTCAHVCAHMCYCECFDLLLLRKDEDSAPRRALLHNLDVNCPMICTALFTTSSPPTPSTNRGEQKARDW